ncbi:MAG TPA: DUF819 family protein [Vicinamibacteria bacterium]|nr:DUF819 family protein [Vicinamibacteria bacterium]
MPEAGLPPAALVDSAPGVLSVLLAVLASLFMFNRHPWGRRLFRVVPLLVFCYFVPAALSNLGVIPLESDVYLFIRRVLLPASLLLLVLATDIPAVLSLGKHAVVLFLAGTGSIALGGPLAFLALGWTIPDDSLEEAWRGLAALCGSWIGGGANFVAVGESVGASPATMSLMVVVDVAVANVWMAVLLWFAGRERETDAKMGADRSRIEAVREKVEHYQAEVARPANLPEMLLILALGIGTTGAFTWVAGHLPDIGTIINGFTWVVCLVTAAGVALSFTRLRHLEGAGASVVGSVFLYLLVATIGASARFTHVLDNLPLLAVGALWMALHAATMLGVRRLLRAPVFFLAVGSQANVGGAASAPVVAAAFHPALATVGVLLAVLGYVLGTYVGIAVAFVLREIARLHAG